MSDDLSQYGTVGPAPSPAATPPPAVDLSSYGTIGPPPAATPENDDTTITKNLWPHGQTAHDFVYSPHGLIREGISTIGKGAKEVTQPGMPAKYQGVSDMLHGAESVAAPAIIGATLPALAAAPVATGLAIGGATLGAGVGGYGAQKLSEAAGGGPEAQQLSSDVGNLVGGIAGGTTAARLGRSIVKLNPERASNRIFRPTPADTDFPEVTPEAFSDLRRYGGAMPQSTLGKTMQAIGKTTGGAGWDQPVVGAADLRVGATPIDTAIKNMQAGLDPWLDRARQMGVQIPGDQIVTATQKAIPDLMWTRDPNGAQALVDQARQAFGGKTFTPDQFRDWLKTENGTLRSFYNQAAPAQGAAQNAGTPSAIEEAQANAIRDNLYRYLDPDNNGDGPREIQRRTGNLYKLRNAAERRYNSILGEKPVTPLAALAQPLSAAVKFFRGDPMGAVGTLEHPFRGPSDAMITDLYRQLPAGADLPQPQQVTPKGLLGPAPIVTPPPPDTSGIRVTTGPPVTGPANRALPPPTQKMPSVDFTAQPPEPGTPPYPGRGISPDSGQRTLPEGSTNVSRATGEVTPRVSQNPTELSGQAGDITDTIPQRNPVTGEVVHVPRPAKLSTAKILGRSIVRSAKPSDQ